MEANYKVHRAWTPHISEITENGVLVGAKGEGGGIARVGSQKEEMTKEVGGGGGRGGSLADNTRGV